MSRTIYAVSETGALMEKPKPDAPPPNQNEIELIKILQEECKDKIWMTDNQWLQAIRDLVRRDPAFLAAIPEEDALQNGADEYLKELLIAT